MKRSVNFEATHLGTKRTVKHYYNSTKIVAFICRYVYPKWKWTFLFL